MANRLTGKTVAHFLPLRLIFLGVSVGNGRATAVTLAGGWSACAGRRG